MDSHRPRPKKRNKAKKTFQLYGKYTPKATRRKQEMDSIVSQKITGQRTQKSKKSRSKSKKKSKSRK